MVVVNILCILEPVYAAQQKKDSKATDKMSVWLSYAAET